MGAHRFEALRHGSRTTIGRDTSKATQSRAGLVTIGAVALVCSPTPGDRAASPRFEVLAWICAVACTLVTTTAAARPNGPRRLLLDVPHVAHAPPASELADSLRAQLGSGVHVDLLEARPDGTSARAHRAWATALLSEHHADAVVWLEADGDSALSLFALDVRDAHPRLRSMRVALGDTFDVERTLAIGARALLRDPDDGADSMGGAGSARSTPSATHPLAWHVALGATVRIPDAAFGVRIEAGLRALEHVGLDLEMDLIAPETTEGSVDRIRLPVGAVASAGLSAGPVYLAAGLLGRLVLSHMSRAAGADRPPADGFGLAATAGVRLEGDLRLAGRWHLTLPVEADARLIEAHGAGFRPADIAPAFELSVGLMAGWGWP